MISLTLFDQGRRYDFINGGAEPKGGVTVLGPRSRRRYAPPRTAKGRAGEGAGGGRPLLPWGSKGITLGKFLKLQLFVDAF